MFLTRKGLWFPLSVLLICTAVGRVCSTKQEDDTIGKAFGSLFKAILSVVKSQFEATKDFVPGIDTTSGSTNQTDVKNMGANDTGDTPNYDTKMGMQVGMKSKNVFKSEESTDLPSIGGEDVPSPSGTGHKTFTEESYDINKPTIEHTDQRVSGEDIQEQVSDQGTGDIVSKYNGSLEQSDEKAPGKSQVHDVSFSGTESMNPEKGLPGFGEVQGTDTWPYQLDVKDMLGVLEQEITEPVSDFESKTTNANQEVDEAGYVQAHNMTQADVANTESSDNQTTNDDTEQNVITQNANQDADNITPIQEGTGLSDVLVNNVDSSITNATGLTDTTLDGNIPADFNEKTAISSIQKLSNIDGGEVRPFKPNVGDVVQTVEKELYQHGISPPSQGHDYLGDFESNGVAVDETLKESHLTTDSKQMDSTDKKNGQAKMNIEEVQPDNTETGSKDSTFDQNSPSPGETKGTQGSEESDTLLRLVNTI
ncbi:uncharacterized protein LOC117332404 [Pecten maximus]|uniref:uncharacterized protein LOC117332404 n=1 Tax=Pecten maximus TaxID=6579 RepID=UPI0014585079|nr:uncharacterized protein LOC117332404 [Pecten maximus]